MKAKFSIKIEHPIDTIALSNFPTKVHISFFMLNNFVMNITWNVFVIVVWFDLKQSVTTSNYKITEFATTQPISTYLVSWLIAPVDGFKPLVDGSIKLHARSDLIDASLLDFAISVSNSILAFYNDYFGYKEEDKFQKLDIVALPNMENIFFYGTATHGLITLKEEQLTYSPKLNDLYQKKRVALKIAFEMGFMVIMSCFFLLLYFK